jgi:hypothetical protein
MKTTSVLSAAALCLLAACADTIPVQPTTATLSTAASRASLLEAAEEVNAISPSLASINNELERVGAVVRVGRVQILYKTSGMNAATSTEIWANDRIRGLGQEWVSGDPRRGGRVGVTYAVGSNTGGFPIVRNAGGGFRFATLNEVNAQIEEGFQAWRDQSCSDAPIERVTIPAGTDPDQLDQFFRGLPPSGNYAPPADIVQAAWHPNQFFRNIAVWAEMPPEQGDYIIGVTFNLNFVDGMGRETDIDRDGNLDIGLSEIFYNQNYLWGNQGVFGETDFFSIIAHESGHALGLSHFGKMFRVKKDVLDGTNSGPEIVSEMKFAPAALMNAGYLTGRTELTGTDHSSFCQIWASKK